MKIINNVPVGYQERFEDDIAFILLHKLINDETYRNFYLNGCKDYGLIILDNSCFELGKSLNGEILMEWASKLKKVYPSTPIEVIIPDHYEDRKKSLKLMEDFLINHYDSGFSYMAVPQGKNSSELKRCLVEMLNDSKINCIGLNKLWRKKDIEFLVPLITSVGVEIHRLGVNNLSDWVIKDDIKHLIRTADSRILAKIVTGVDEGIWDEKLSTEQEDILFRLIEEVKKW